MEGQEEERTFAALFHFISDCTGEIMMLKEVEIRYNKKHPNSQKTSPIIRGYLLLGWVDFEKKNKRDFAKYVDVLQDIKKDIEQKKIGESDVPEAKRAFIRGNYNLFEKDYNTQW